MANETKDGLGTPDWIRCPNCSIQLVEESEYIKRLENQVRALEQERDKLKSKLCVICLDKCLHMRGERLGEE